MSQLAPASTFNFFNNDTRQSILTSRYLDIPHAPSPVFPIESSTHPAFTSFDSQTPPALESGSSSSCSSQDQSPRLTAPDMHSPHYTINGATALLESFQLSFDDLVAGCSEPEPGLIPTTEFMLDCAPHRNGSGDTTKTKTRSAPRRSVPQPQTPSSCLRNYSCPSKGAETGLPLSHNSGYHPRTRPTQRFSSQHPSSTHQQRRRPITAKTKQQSPGAPLIDQLSGSATTGNSQVCMIGERSTRRRRRSFQHNEINHHRHANADGTDDDSRDFQTRSVSALQIPNYSNDRSISASSPLSPASSPSASSSSSISVSSFDTTSTCSSPSLSGYPPQSSSSSSAQALFPPIVSAQFDPLHGAIPLLPDSAPVEKYL